MLGCLWVLREFGSEVRFWLEVCGSDWETHLPWVGSGLRNGKETHRGSNRDWEMERKLTVGLRLTLVGLWVELRGVRVECAVRSVLLWGMRVRACAAVRSVLLWESSNRVVWGMKMVWSENMNINDFTGVLGYFTIKGEKHFSWLNLLVQPNTQVLRKNISGSNLKPKQTQP